MRVDCPRKELFEAVSAANAAASGRSPIAILQNLKLDGDETGMRVLGCDGEMWVERRVACMVEEPGAVCVPSKLMNDLVSNLPDGDIQLQTSDTQGMLLKQGASEYRVLTHEPSDFPEPPSFGGEGELTLKMGVFKDAVDSVLFAVSTDSHRPILTGVLFQYDGTTLTLVATDTHRLAVRRVAQEGIGSNVTAVVPERALRAMKNMPIGDDEDITIRFGGGRLGVDSSGARIISQLLAGTYPNWERVVPSEFTRAWRVEADQLVERVKRVLILARDNAFRIRMSGTGDQLLLTARSDERGEAKEQVTMLPQNGDIEIAFNGNFIRDALSGIKGPGVRIEMTENSRAAVFRPTDDDTYLCVIMPMALF